MKKKVNGENSTMPEYSKDTDELPENNSHFLKVELDNGKDTFIRKSTAVWLFQETERVSSDRLICVRAKQPNEIKFHPVKETAETLQPSKFISIKIGDMCAFKDTCKSFKIGKVLQFVEYNNKKQKAYKGDHANVNHNCGVICTWYIAKDEGDYFEMATLDTTYHHLSTYSAPYP